MKKKPAFYGIAALLLVTLILTFNAHMSSRDAKLVDFYETPLVCAAAPSIGCGSRSKPVLLALEKENTVAEAWLNRGGTIIGIVWNEAASENQKRTVTDSAFARHTLHASIVQDAERRTELLANFGAEDSWYRGRQVDQLSREEASIVAERVAGMIENYHALDSELRAKVVASVKPVFEKWFTDDILAARIHGAESEQANLEMQQELVVVCSELLGEDVVAELLKHMGR